LSWWGASSAKADVHGARDVLSPQSSTFPAKGTSAKAPCFSTTRIIATRRTITAIDAITETHLPLAGEKLAFDRRIDPFGGWPGTPPIAPAAWLQAIGAIS
jgi:hypothetical protein